MADHSDSFSLTPSKYLCGVPDGMQPIVVSQQLETLQAGPQVIQPPCLSRVTGGACKKWQTICAIFVQITKFCCFPLGIACPMTGYRPMPLFWLSG